jgi:Zn-dependent alcohol dehydrogenase
VTALLLKTDVASKLIEELNTETVFSLFGGKLKIDELITHKLKLEQINEGFDLMKRGESIRSIVVY